MAYVLRTVALLLLTTIVELGLLFLSGTIGPAMAIVISCLVIIGGSWTIFALCSSILSKGLGLYRRLWEIVGLSASQLVVLNVGFGLLFQVAGVARSSAPDSPITNLVDLTYFSVVTWTTLGYGDIIPSRNAEYVVIAEVLLSYVMMAFLTAAFIKSLPAMSARS